LPINTTIRFTYDSLLQYDSCTIGGMHNPTNHTIEWVFNNFQHSDYLYSNHVNAYFTVPVSASIDDTVHSYFEILPIVGDVCPSDNTLLSIEPITNSHDPNDKSLMPIGKNAANTILQNDSVLLYTIRFQNTGNDTAFTVVVKDTLSPYLDPATIVPGASSHPYTFDLSGNGILTFRFDNIMLPDSNVNEPTSHGYFNYSIKQKKNNPLEQS